MGSEWKKAKDALGLNLCMFVPRTLDDDFPPSTVISERLSDAALLSLANYENGSSRPTTATVGFFVGSFHLQQLNIQLITMAERVASSHDEETSEGSKKK
ncbi:hypothetical protein P8452_63499 [Trifolium repens]|nr:hypothetical protein P8452_63499 [Trifolium repens]